MVDYNEYILSGFSFTGVFFYCCSSFILFRRCIKTAIIMQIDVIFPFYFVFFFIHFLSSSFFCCFCSSFVCYVCSAFPVIIGHSEHESILLWRKVLFFRAENVHLKVGLTINIQLQLSSQSTFTDYSLLTLLTLETVCIQNWIFF